MKPYYERDGIQLYHADCLELLPTMAAGSFDAVVTDPPYGVNFKYALACDDDAFTHNSKVPNWFSAMRTATAGPIAIATGIKSLPIWMALIERPTWILCWWKAASSSRCHVGFNNWEPIVLWGEARGKKGCDVFRSPCYPREDIGHPCPKPDEWADGLLRLIAAQKDRVLDPFAGSGTTGVAAWRLGRKCTLIEIEEKYCEIAAKRIDAEITKGRLFPPEPETVEQKTLEFNE